MTATAWTEDDPDGTILGIPADFVGPQGPAGTIAVGAVTTGAPGSVVVVQNSGTPSNAILDFTIPRGDLGPPPADADGATKGILKLAGDLGGTADAPTVPGLAGKANTAHTHTKTYRLVHTFTISGDVFVASGDLYYVPPFFVDLPAGQTATIVQASHRLKSGTSATWTISHGAPDAGTAVTGLTGVVSAAGARVDTAATAANVLADGDAVQLVVSAVAGSPKNLTVSVFIDVTA